MTKRTVKYIFSALVAAALVVYLFWINRPTMTTPVATNTDTGSGDDIGNPPATSTTTSDQTANSQPSTDAASFATSHNLAFGSTGADVITLQQMLIDKGYLTAVSSPTGWFGPLTKAALAESQTASANDNATTTVVASSYKDGTYTGIVADAVYGQLQVVATISGGKITDVSWPVAPDSPGHTSQVTASALPKLKQEAIASQSANVNIISGATQDSQAFQESLASALAQAKS